MARVHHGLFFMRHVVMARVHHGLFFVRHVVMARVHHGLFLVRHHVIIGVGQKKLRRASYEQTPCSYEQRFGGKGRRAPL